ncbi:MAG: enoyl-CoA hydratase/carnithine racemase [Paracoccaceae bacterium]|jgi:enoyl-CoA hydratase/carnithine racemase
MKDSQSDPILLTERQGSIARLIMNSPANLNALSNTMLKALQGSLDEIAQNKAIKVVVLSGLGKAFCAGHNLKEMMETKNNTDGGKAGLKDLFDTCKQLMLTIRDMPQPVIAQVHGLAAAAGCQLVASCDLATASENAVFGVNGVNIGLFCSTPMVALTRNIPRKQAFEMLTTGDFISATKALELGLINRVSSEGKLGSETLEFAEKIAAKLSAAVRIGKKAFYKQLEMPISEAYEYTGKVMVENMALQDTQEGISAFLEKRPPKWER